MLLVTGADGFIGSHLVEHLVRRGEAVRALVLYQSTGEWGWLEHADPEVRAAIEVVAGDVRDPECVRDAMRGCTAVAHLAALIAIPYSYRAPRSYLETNLHGTLHVLQSAREFGARVVQVSTSEVYGSARAVPMTEEHPLCAQSPYAASKIAADQLAHSFHCAYGLPVTLVRPFNTYGPRQSTRAVIPSVILQLLSGRELIELGSLEPTRDFSFVSDTVRGIAAALLSERAVGQTVHLGTGHEISIGELVELIARVLDRPARVMSRSERLRPAASEVDRLCADASRAAALLGHTPEFAGRAGLERGLRITAEWFRKPPARAAARACAFVL
jgi:dTDP-glucose 4,6-dehydratase